MMKNLAAYLCLLASGVLTLVSTASATPSSRSLRGGTTTTTTEPKLLAHVEVTPNATVDMLLTEGGVLVISAEANERDFGLLEAAMENAQPEQDANDFAGFYQKLAGTEDAPDELVQLTDRMQQQQQQQQDWDDDEVQDDDEETIDIDNADDAMVEFDGDDNDETRRRLQAFCSFPYGNIGNCRCYTYKTGNAMGNAIYDTWMYSHLNPYRGSVRHTIASSVDGFNWSVVISRSRTPGLINTLKATNTLGLKTYFKAYTTYATGDGYHWRYC